MTHLAGVPGLLLVILILLAYVGLALAPFNWVPPRRVANGATVNDDGIRFHAAGLAYSHEAPRWLERAAEFGQLRIRLRFRADPPSNRGPARILTLSRDLHLRNLTLDQNGSDLVLWLRRPGSTANGIPRYKLRGVVRNAGWHDVDIAIAPGSLTVSVNDAIVLARPLPERPLADWDRRYRLALGNELNGIRPWRGDIARAVVDVAGQHVDYTIPGALEVPPMFWAFANRATWGFEDYVHPLSTKDWIGNFLGFIPLGFVLAALLGKHGSWRKAVTICAAASLVVEIAQAVFSRHPSAVDFLLNSLGAAVGAAMASWFIAKVHDAASSVRGARV